MSGFQDHFGGHARAYASARPDYPEALFDWLARQSAGHALAWDCATGSGQAASRLRERYARVIATDASPGQLASARAHPGVSYVAASAERAPIAAGTVDVITVAQSLHWFDTSAFFAETERLLRPGGVLAVWGYGLCHVTPAVDGVLGAFHDTRLAPWWPRERWWVAAGYPELRLPFEALQAPAFAMERDWDLATFLAYVATWSGVKRAEAAGESPVDELARELRPLWLGEQRVRWPLTLRAARKRAG